MASLKDIKRRITSVKSTQKITNAMKLVSASKFAKASHAVQSARPYGNALDVMAHKLVGSVGDELESSLVASSDREAKILVVVVGSDRGLCGPLNTYVSKKTLEFLQSKPNVEVEFKAWGRRPGSFVKKTGKRVLSVTEKILADTSYTTAKRLSDELIGLYESDHFDAVYVVYPEFKSAIQQDPTVLKLLPFSADGAPHGDGEADSHDYLVEPDLKDVVDPLIRRWVCSRVHRILLDGAASEHGARMSAMENATNNAKEVTRKLTLAYNRARQAAITTELTEIISGAEALN